MGDKLRILEEAFAKRLPNTSFGNLVFRFAPEPSGYLHIGHLKALLLNSFYANYFNGKLIFRFDDTNPSKEKDEFEASIIEDMRKLNINYEGPTYTSDYMLDLIEMMRNFIATGNCYVDDTDQQKMKVERLNKIESEARNNSIETNLKRFEGMLRGDSDHLCMCVRAKLDMQSANGAMRDPVLWRCNVEVLHHRHGNKYKSYPTYDFACPIVDSISGVTHALRSNEYADRIPLYEWVINISKLRPVTIYEFSRLNFTNTVLSKRKLCWLVNANIVSGWDDPRLPTLRGIMRRGMLKDALHEFLMEQGPSKNTNLMEWDKVWSINTKMLDKISKRYFAVRSNAIRVKLLNYDEHANIEFNILAHQQNESLGIIKRKLSNYILIDREDGEQLAQNEEVTLMSIGNMIIHDIVCEDNRIISIVAKLNLAGDFKKTKKKLHWICDTSNKVKIQLVEYDNLITKRQPEESDTIEDIINTNSKFVTELLGESAITCCKVDETIQLVRISLVRIDSICDNCYTLILIPSGKQKTMSALSTKVQPTNISKGVDNSTSKIDKPSKKALKRAAWKATTAQTAE